MHINHNIHNRNHLVKSLLGNTEYAINHIGLEVNKLYVVNYHGTQKKFLTNFNNQLNFLKKEFEIISPARLNDFYAGRLKSQRPLLLITFDDGIKNNLLAAELLDKYNIKAYFFVIPSFINTSVDKQKEYFIRFIRPKINPTLDSKAEDFTALNWDELNYLRRAGHCIGSHTYTHGLIAKDSTLENSIHEIKDSKLSIAQHLQIAPQSIDSFCSINNTLESVSFKEHKIIKDNYTYHFTTIPGMNDPESSPYFIKRSNIESHWLPGALKYALGKWGLKRWKNNTDAFTQLMQEK